MKSRVIVVTGASAGIGAALSELGGKRDAKVVLVARREKELADVAARAGAETLTVVADVTRRADVERARDAALARFGQIDVWVNNAGRGISRVVSELTDDDLDEMMTTNLKSALYGMQAVLPHFKERKRGHIVNVSSLLGRLPLAPFRSAYSASKHALNALTANLRVELRDAFPDIHVSSVHPGVVSTEFGVKSLHGGVDSRALPGAQSAEEVAAVIADLITKPAADVYTRPGAREMVAAYYGAEDMSVAELGFGRIPSR
ncbi:MAG TPA: SDR family oxidoreductase [Polyangiaceae bacterium]|jgi:NADP-dependent 3-hydroxy acid dehydrogenase YdfG|nr:SDR family oxidoreductase [Polyangiaceae bacterium]